MITKHPTANVWIHPNGIKSRYPPYETANELKTKMYDDGEKCPVCNGSTLRYLRTGNCRLCAINHSQLLYNLITTNDHDRWIIDDPHSDGGIHFCNYNKPTPISREKLRIVGDAMFKYMQNPETYKLKPDPCPHGHIGLYLVNGRCATCHDERVNSPRAIARKANQPTYTPADPCDVCHQLAPRRTTNDKCTHCHPLRPANSPRQAAIRQGHKWYLPDEPCPRCHQIAERRVSNGQCRGCTPHLPAPVQADSGAVEDGRRTAESVMMEECPELIVSKEEAKQLGLKVYRTGKECKRGHTAYRYVSTGSCITCLRMTG